MEIFFILSEYKTLSKIKKKKLFSKFKQIVKKFELKVYKYIYDQCRFSTYTCLVDVWNRHVYLRPLLTILFIVQKLFAVSRFCILRSQKQIPKIQFHFISTFLSTSNLQPVRPQIFIIFFRNWLKSRTI